MSQENGTGVTFASARRRHTRWLGRRCRRASDSRGMALVTTLFVIFFLGMMLFSFAAMMQSEAGFAGLSRNSTIALGLAEAGAQEAIARLNLYGKGPGTTCYPNSLAGSGTCSGGAPVTNAVGYEAALQNNPQIFPILSIATFGGATRAVRIFEQVMYKPGDGNIVFGPQVTFSGNANQITGDSYSLTYVQFASYAKAPQCSSGTTATNLLAPQVLAGTTIGAGNGPNQTTPCGDTNAGSSYSTECASAPNEVAPTPCPGGRASAGGHTLPVNWHPMTPVGMGSTDFTTLATWVNKYPTQAGNLGLSMAHAQQNSTDVIYTPVSYTPSYWSSISGSTGRVLLVTASQIICVNPANTVDPVDLPNPVGTRSCAATNGGTPYGTGSGTTPTRFLDWGLVQDDLTRAQPQTFFQAPACAAPCANPGNQNGIRYIPVVPQVNVVARACDQNVNPGFNVFDNLNSDPACPNPPTQNISTTSVTFSGTYTNPEALVIDNPTTQVTINPSINGPGSCTSNFQNYNWGVILATGDLSFAGNTVFSGFIYTYGNIYTSGTVVFNGGVYASSINPTTVDQVDSTGNFSECAGSAAALPQSPLFFKFKVISWQDRPANTP